MRRLALLPVLVTVVGCYGNFATPTSQAEAWQWFTKKPAKQYLDEHPIIMLRPEEEATEECDYLGPVYAGPGIGVASEQRDVLIVSALMGATHVQWQDVETAHFYRCDWR